MPTQARPCIPGDAEGRSCLAGLLLGVACCPNGDCAICARDRARMRRQGYTEDEVTARVARARARLLTHCPTCDFPPPPPLQEIPPLPRLDRSDRTVGAAWTCRICNRPLPQGRRTYCTRDCYLESERRRERA